MAGVDHIVDEILQEAREKAAAIRKEAEQQAEEIRDKARKDGERLTEKKTAQAESDAKAFAERVESQISLQRKQALLAEKQDIIQNVIAEAGKRLMEQDGDAYFGMLLTMVERNVRPEAGEILLSERDAQRMPDSFAEKVRDAAAKAGGSLKISERPASIESGFILRYGGIDENCSLQALFSEKQDKLQDEVHRVLWGGR